MVIEVGNSFSRIAGLTTEQFSRLKKELSYELDPQQAYFAGGHRPRTKSLLDAKGNFPTGLLKRVKRFYPKAQVVDNRVVPLARCRPDYGCQHALYRAQTDAIFATLAHPRGTISMPTGTGKSAVIAGIIAIHNLNTLVIVPSLEIKKQLIASLLRNFSSMRGIRVENIDSAALKTEDRYDVLIIDEAHHVAAKTYHKLNKTVWKNIYHRYFLTATPFRNNANENLLFEAIAGEVIYKLSYKEAIKSGYIVPVTAHTVTLAKTPNDFYTWAEVYRELVVEHRYRNIYIAHFIDQMKLDNISTLCLVKEIKHGKILSELTGIPFVNGQDEESRAYITAFNNKEIPVLIGTTGVIGEGVDTKPCEYVVIAGLGKAKSAFLQQIGRGVRTYPGKQSCKVVLFKDASHKFTLRHYKEQCKVLLEEFGIKPEEM